MVMLHLADRVAQRYRIAQHRRADSYGDPGDLFKKYQETVDEYAKHEQTAKEWLHGYHEIERLRASGSGRSEQEAVREKYMITDVQRDGQGNLRSYRNKSGGPENTAAYEGRSGRVGHSAKQLCLGILQQLALPTGIRKTIETSAKWWNKAVRLPKGNSHEETTALRVEMYLEHLESFRKYEKVYADAIRLGKAHEAEGEGATKMTAGPFTVINTGGFSADVMEKSTKIAIEVAHRMERIGLGKVCYGGLNISGQLMGKNVAAFYSPGQDEMFIRPNIPGDGVRYICHELTHRLVNKYLKSKKGEIDQVYDTLKSSKDSGLKFVTPYARKGGPEENFCEMVASWAMGQLPSEQIALVKEVLS